MKQKIFLLASALLISMWGWAQGEGNIAFADDEVKAICVANWDTDGDGELSTAEAAAVTDLGTVFQNNSQITSFTELENFIGLTSIGNETFLLCRNLTTVIIPKNVTSIGQDAFTICDNLASLNIPEGVTSIGAKAFHDCSSLTSLLLPNSLVSIDDGAFMDCSGLTTMTIPKGVTSIGYRIFDDCGSLATITVESGNANYDSRENCNAIIETSSNTLISGCNNTIIPNGVTKIGDGAFAECSNITSIIIPNSVTSIGRNAFIGCQSLISVNIPSNVASIAGDAFRWCAGLTSITVDDGNTMYDSRNGCNAIIEKQSNRLIIGCRNSVIPTNVTSIGDYAFSGCRGLASVSIPDVVTSIGDYAFDGCSGLTSVTIPSNVTSIGRYAFSACSNLATITIPNSVKSIGSSAFQGTVWYENLPDGLVYAGNVVYKYKGTMPEDTKIIIDDGTMGIAGQCFLDCTGLVSVTIPSSVVSINESAFYRCRNLSSVTSMINEPFSILKNVFDTYNYPNATLYVPSGSKTKYQATEGWKNFNKIYELEDGAGTTIIEFADDNVKALCVTNWDTNKDGELSKNEAAAVTSLGTVFKGNTTIASFDELQYFSGLTSISENAFKDCSALKSVIIPEGVEDIFEYAFSDCSALNSVTIPESVVNILDFAFYQCRALSSVILPNKLERICRSAFSWSGLTSLIIPKSVRLITTGSGRLSNYGAFSNCGRLQSIVVEEGNPNFDSRDNCNAIIRTNTNELIVGCTNTVIPSTVTKIGDCAFIQSGVRSISIPEGVTVIGNAAFAGCTLTSVDLPNSLTTIGDDAFHDDNEITAITIPSGVTSIGKGVFIDCHGITSVTSMISEPFDISNIGFEIYQSATLYVPSGCKEKYETTEGWKKFSNIQEYDPKKRTIHVATAGTLPTLISADDKYLIEELTLSGELNGTDIHFIRDMAGVNMDLMEDCEFLPSFDAKTEGKLRLLDMSNANIVEGGRDYFKMLVSSAMDRFDYFRYTETNAITDFMFAYCWKLEELILPKSVTSISAPFHDSGLSLSFLPPNIKVLKIAEGNPYYVALSDDIGIIDKNTNTLILGTNIIPDNVISVGNSAFCNANLTSLTIPSSVTSIGETAFYNCNLQFLTAEPTTPPLIAENSFPNHSNIALHVPAGCVEAYTNADYWKDFKSIGAIGTIIEGDIFTATTIEGVNLTYSVTSSSPFEVEMQKVAPNMSTLSIITIPSSVIGPDDNEYAVTGIGSSAFSFCRDLTSVIIPGSVSAIGYQAFFGCTSLNSISIPRGVTTIGGSAFQNCTNLVSVSLPYSVTSIDNNIFRGCNSLTSVAVDIQEPLAISSYDISNLANATLYVPKGSKAAYEAADYWKEFKEVVEFTNDEEITYLVNEEEKEVVVGGTTEEEESVEIPESVTIDGEEYDVTGIAPNAFEGNETLKEVSIPATVTSIGENAFGGCKNLSDIWCYSENPIELGNKVQARTRAGEMVSVAATVFAEVDLETCVLHVPAGSKELYEAAEGWGEFANIVEIESGSSTEVTIKITEKGKSTYCSEYDLDFSSFGDNLKAYVATGYNPNTGTIWMTRVMDVPAGTGIFLKGNAGDYNVPITTSKSYYRNMMDGTVEGCTIPKSDGGYTYLYLTVPTGGSELAFCTLAEDSKAISAHKAYLKIPKTFTPTTVPTTDYEPIEISEYGKSTYCSNNDLDFGKVSGLSAYVATGYSNNTGTIWMTRVNDVPAGTGVFLKGTPGMYHVPTIAPSSKTMYQSVYENMMVGTLTGATIPSTTGTYKNMYLTVEGGTLKFCGIAGDSRSIGANKAYLQIPLSVLAKARGSKTSEEVVLDYSFSDEVIGVPVMFLGEATAIQAIGSLQSTTDRWYNLKGQRVENPGKGLYIKNGKKIVIK